MRALWHIFYRSAAWEWRVIARSRIEKVMVFLLPIIAISSIWLTFSAGQVHNLPIGILDKDNTSLSRKLIQTIEASPNVTVAARYRNAQAMQTDLRNTDVYAAVIIPKDFARNIYQVKPSPVTLVVDAQYGTHSGIIQSGVGNAVRTFSAGTELRLKKKMGMSNKQALDALMPIRPKAKMAFNLQLNYQQFLAATVIPALLHILATVIGVGAIGRKLRDKTIGTWFWGVTRSDLNHTSKFFAVLAALFGKLFWHSIIFCFWISFALLLVARTENPPIGNLSITIIAACLFMILSLWLGAILTTMAMSKRMGLSNAGVITAPAFAFSGITYPLAAMPHSAQVIAKMLPLTHYEQLQVAQIEMHQAWQAGLPTIYGFLLTITIMIILSALLMLRALKNKHRWGMR